MLAKLRGRQSSHAIAAPESTRSRASIRKTPDRPLRLWDRFDGDLVERQLAGEHVLLCNTLGVHRCVQSNPTLGRVLRISSDALGQSLVPSTLERERAALERVAELEAELRHR